MSDGTLATRASVWSFRSKRLLAHAGDDRLVERIRLGDELAFEVAFERYGGGILGFCRHMLGSREEAEDAVQQTFAAALRGIEQGGERRIALKPWLYTIARNRCLSTLRARREHAGELEELPTEGLEEQVGRRLELRELLSDLRELPEEQRAALLLAEAGGLSHPEIADALGCEVARVKALVFRARSGLIERRAARDTPCAEIREQLANLRGGALRRSELRHHLRHCPGCSEYRAAVRRQRQLLGAALPVMPTAGLKSSVLAAFGVGGGAAGGGGAAAAGIGGLGPAIASLVSGTAAKVAVVGALGGSVVAGGVTVERALEPQSRDGGSPATRPAPGRPADEGPGAKARLDALAGIRGERMRAQRSHGRRGAETRSLARSRARQSFGGTRGSKRERAHDRALSRDKRAANQPSERGQSGPGDSLGRAGGSGRQAGAGRGGPQSGGQAGVGRRDVESGTAALGGPPTGAPAPSPQPKQPPATSPKTEAGPAPSAGRAPAPGVPQQ